MNYQYIFKKMMLLLFMVGGSNQLEVSAQSALPKTIEEGLSYRMVGPTRGGRVTTVSGHPTKMHTFFMGSTGGGVWQTDDAGTTWKNISDKYLKSGSIGAIEVAPSNPNTLYVGTGSACPRGNISIGDGMYKSTDGGHSWSAIGLSDAGLISEVIVHPKNEKLAYVAVLGQIFGSNKTRGIYRTTNGGQDWENILFVSDTTGASDLVINPENPNELYAAFWRAERKPWTMIDGGYDGGIWKSIDGGDNWEKLTNGLPTGLLGKIGLAIAPTQPNRIWALIQAKEEESGGLYRSDDSGQTWKRINRDHNLRQRGWYYTHLTAHPTDPNTVYANNVQFLKSIDGGKNFDQRISVPHGDNHDLWVNPKHPEIMIHANDGGACVTLNGGETWSSQNNQPTAEFYRVSVDNQFPYRIYGAQQDNTTISVPSKFEPSLTNTQNWYAVGGGESGHIAIDPRDPNLIYAGTYIGQITRLNRTIGKRTGIMAYPQMHDGVAPKDIKYRFQWNAPIRISPHNPDLIYHCSQYVHQSIDGGINWEIVSPDLTTNNPAYHQIPGGPIQHDHTGVELYTTIFAFEESPHQQGELWAGTDDGRLHITKDGGKNWQEITPSSLPREGTINSIDLSVHEPGRAIISVYKYRENDFTPYIFLTNNYGKSWQSLTNGKNGLKAPHFVRVVREDPKRKGLLFAGTEFGMYFSIDEGKQWMPFQLNLPVTPITDCLIKGNDLVIATQGRSFWIMDDISPLRTLNQDLVSQKIHLFNPSTAYRTQFSNYRGQQGPDKASNGALIYFYVHPEQVEENITLHILDKEGKARRTFSTQPIKKQEKLKVNAGLNRMEWDLKYEKPVLQPKAVFSLANTGGLRAPTGSHSIQLIMGSDTLSATFDLRPDPRWKTTPDEFEAQYQLGMDIKDLLNDCHEAIGNIRLVRNQVQMMEKQVKSTKPEVHQSFCEKSKPIIDNIDRLEKALIQSKSESRQDPINFPPMLDDQIAFLYSFVNRLDEKPNAGTYERYNDLKQTFAGYQKQIDSLMEKELTPINQWLVENQINYIGR